MSPPARQLERFDNLVSLFLTRAAEKGDQPFLWAKREGNWRSTSWSETSRQVASLAHSLRKIGLRRGDRVALVSENRPEWLIADLAIMAAGCVTVPTYTTNTARDHIHILGNSGARAVIVSNQKLANNLIPAVLTSSECHHVIAMEPLRTGQAPDWVNCHSFRKLASGEGDVVALEREVADIGRQDLACLIYTSGTGGSPRGVQQHHGRSFITSRVARISFRPTLAGRTRSFSLFCQRATPTSIPAASISQSPLAPRFIMPRASKSSPRTSRKSSPRS